MSITFNIKLHHIPKKSGEYSIVLKITKDRIIKSVTLPVTVKNKNHLNANASRGHWIRKGDPDYVIKNNTIMDHLKRYEATKEELLNKKGTASLNMIVIRTNKPQSADILEYSDRLIGLQKLNGQLNYAKHFKSVFKKLRNYVELKKNTELLFEDIDVGFLKDYEAYLSSLGNQRNTIAKNIKIIRAAYYSAIKEAIIENVNNPFVLFKIKTTRTNNKALTLEELQLITNKEIEAGSQVWHTRNYFLFCIYCAGIRISDLMCLKWANIQSDRLEYVMRKNGKTQNIMLNKKALNILAYYKTRPLKPSAFIFPILDNKYNLSKGEVLMNQISSKTTVINRNLKELASSAKVKKQITTHMARHTFSDIARQKGADLFDISKLLKHSDLKTTQQYLATIDQKSADSVLDNL